MRQKEQEIRLWFDRCDTRHPRVRAHLLRAVKMIYARQTTSEQMSHTTRVSNNAGFNSADAGYFSWVAQTFHNSMPNRVALICKFRMRKYSRQLADIALDNALECGIL